MAGLKEYKPYEHYEDAYAVWYKKKPTHWKCEKFKYYFSEKFKQNAVHLKAGAISFGEVIYKDENNLSIDTKSSYQEVLAGEFVINPLNLNFDLKSLRTALSKINVVVSTGYIILRINGLLNPQYARWLLHQFDVAHMKTLGSGVRQTINYNDIGNSFFCRPTLEEQKKIAAFLDYKSIKIERLIRKQLNLIELLKEKRQAVISHAVTKGLNPDVPMKDSGVEWLDKVPTHWLKTSIKYTTKLNPVKKSLESSLDQKCSFIPMEKLKLGRIILDKIKVVKEVYHAYIYFENDDILIAKVTPCFENKNFAIARNLVNGLGFGSTEIYVLRCNSSISNEFVFYRLQESNFSTIAERAMTGAGGLKRVPSEVVSSFKYFLPSLIEQQEIASFLNSETQKIDILIQKQLQQIELLKVRRTALISAAVTGKIDLRDWTPPASSPEESLTAEEATA
ncbi:restriction endonuclease subunit S [Enterobacter chengduensis]|uniref:restriction endonuclease subunit S n=1 Tax=Enterobacter chengduensis TaxID=2494701 RepID=UPI002006D199|nr:restriction endonuclease subunit S [Enterobacter chengduensis]MCK7431481.1 restriction endonuclease subunit S [Enterobacter chengduensis]